MLCHSIGYSETVYCFTDQAFPILADERRSGFFGNVRRAIVVKNRRAIHYPLSVIILTAINKRKLKIQSDIFIFIVRLYFIVTTFHKFTIISLSTTEGGEEREG